jgi:hypothetical protein
MAQKPKGAGSSLKELIPLHTAAALAYQRVYGDAHRSASGLSNDHVHNVMAHVLAAFGTVYVLDAAKAEIAALDPKALDAGVFRDGGERLFFHDGRPQLTRLAVKNHDLQKTIYVLIQIKAPFDEIPVPEELRRG